MFGLHLRHISPRYDELPSDILSLRYAEGAIKADLQKTNIINIDTIKQQAHIRSQSQATGAH